MCSFAAVGLNGNIDAFNRSSATPMTSHDFGIPWTYHIRCNIWPPRASYLPLVTEGHRTTSKRTYCIDSPSAFYNRVALVDLFKAMAIFGKSVGMHITGCLHPSQTYSRLMKDLSTEVPSANRGENDLLKSSFAGYGEQCDLDIGKGGRDKYQASMI